MSRSALAFAPSTPVVELAPWVSAPLSVSWQLWADRLEAVLSNASQGLSRRGRRARKLTVSLHFADGSRRRRTLALPRATGELAELRPAALGLLRLLVDQHPGQASRVAVSLGGLVEGANQPIRFERYLRARKPKSVLRRVLAKLFG